MAEQGIRLWSRKDLVAIEDLSRSEIEMILDLAPQFVAVSQRESGIKKVPLLQGRLVVNWFFEPSTRTRTSFELAAKRLSADTLTMNVAVSSAKKGETLHDTLYNIEAMHSDIVVIRHSYAGAAKILADRHPSSVINAGDGAHEHPTQALLDAFTMRQHIRRLRQEENAGLDGVRVAIIGDIAHSRVARSNIWCLKKLGASVTVCGPSTLLPVEIEKMGVRVTTKLREALEDVDVVYVLRIQLERQQKCLFPSLREYVRLFRIDEESLKAAPDHAIVMHPGPINRDVELSASVADGPRNVILEQVSNGVAVRMAVMHLLVNKPQG
ncbi:MAG TPA: aspartate carbamoyltransferase catalytic subunit [Candidatus Hydrogenedentes bacterium]|nr:aspartate carbamoyltransferase catalytic subunit [Candidatus Hydrogenedentota bacterium]HOL76946.1 aspartate carbamoyltransferase catalytic subunit [Candidatus Hydrogenedentota bacterium]HPO86665.1 aspartate carbamoyltransferase catalytic subunit [Candidatus Hydrogenedentota bacterium]